MADKTTNLVQRASLGHLTTSKSSWFRSTVLTVVTCTAALSMLILVSLAAHASEPIQDWVPDVLVFPDDTEVVTGREIGSTIRMLSIRTAVDADDLLTDWQAALQADGYIISETGVGSLERVIEFSGLGIANAKIIISPASSAGRNVIEFDATLN